MKVRTVGVLGCGLMGSGIAQVCAQAGYETIVREVDDFQLQKGIGRIEKFLDDSVERNKITITSRDETLIKLKGTTELEDLRSCDLVIEAIVERIEDKKCVLQAVEEILSEQALLFSNTSSLCITELATAIKRPDRFAGLHFFSPVPVMRLVEVIRGLLTSAETARSAVTFARSIGKESIIAPDRPGFIVNRLLIPYLLSAVRAYEAQIGTLEDIDKSMTLGCGHPMGPFELLDFVGLDTTYYIATIMYEEFRDSAYAPPPLLKRMVLAGRLGRKTGEGFFTY